MGKLYYTIGEVAEMLHENSSTLRFWEKSFPQLKPVKNSKGDRRYVEGDIELLRCIQQLTRDAGYTIEGAREQLRHDRTQVAATLEPQPDPVREQVIATLRQAREQLTHIAEQLEER